MTTIITGCYTCDAFGPASCAVHNRPDTALDLAHLPGYPLATIVLQADDTLRGHDIVAGAMAACDLQDAEDVTNLLVAGWTRTSEVLLEELLGYIGEELA